MSKDYPFHNEECENNEGSDEIIIYCPDCDTEMYSFLGATKCNICGCESIEEA